MWLFDFDLHSVCYLKNIIIHGNLENVYIHSIVQEWLYLKFTYSVKNEILEKLSTIRQTWIFNLKTVCIIAMETCK